MASTSNSAPVLASGQVLIKTKDKDVEMSIQHSISSGRRLLDAAEDHSGTPAPNHDHNKGSQARHDDSASASELDDQDPAEHDEAHDEYGNVMDHGHPSLNKGDNNDNVDKHKMAALRSSEALFGFDSSGSELRGPSQQISGLANLQQLLSSGTLGSLDSMGFSGFCGPGGIMAGFTHQLKNILNSLKARGPGTSTDWLVALQELAEILAVSNKDTLAGYFQTDSFARELVSILRGSPEQNELEDEDENEVALVAALTDGHGNASIETPNPGGDVEQMLLALGCLANLMEALPGSAHTVVHHGAVPVLCAKLLEINFIDLAEQSLSTLEKVSEELPSSIVREGGLTALLQYLEFFFTDVQLTAVTTAANCCCSVSSENFETVHQVFPILRDVLSYSDQRVSKQAVLAITRVANSYRHHPEKLQQLLTFKVLSSLTSLMSPIGGIKISDNIFSAILKSFTTIGQSNPEVATKLIDAGLADTVYGILVGQQPPNIADEYELGVHLTKNSSLITQALMWKDKIQIQQIIDLLVEVLPPLPKFGVFDPELAQPTAVNSEGPNIEQEERATSASSKVNVAPTLDGNDLILPYLSSTEGFKPEDFAGAVAPSAAWLYPSRLIETSREVSTPHRINPSLGEQAFRRFYSLILPILLEVYGASVSSTIGLKTLIAILKTIVRIYNFEPMMDMPSLLNPSIYEQSIVNHEDISEYGSDFDMNQSSLGDSKCSTLHITNIPKNIRKHEIEERFSEAGSLHRAFLLERIAKSFVRAYRILGKGTM
ncbi:armadillo-type protein [Phakopsora pachyrhizi]|nr:armadillo-type protein [Phakopsora pachyrhizi]